jgi:hypothetical protein
MEVMLYKFRRILFYFKARIFHKEMFTVYMQYNAHKWYAM